MPTVVASELIIVNAANAIAKTLLLTVCQSITQDSRMDRITKSAAGPYLTHHEDILARF
jgi:hypothetical protein